MALLALSPLPAPAAPRRPSFKLLKTIDLPNIGLRIPIMSGSGEVPLPSPSAATYTFTQDGRSWKEEGFLPAELWRQTQQAGSWTDEHGNRLTLAVVTAPMPVGFPREHASRKEFDDKMQELTLHPSPWNPQGLAQWLADFAGVPAPDPQALAKRPGNLLDVLWFNLGTGLAGTRHAVAFRLRRGAAGQSRATLAWFMAIFETVPEIPDALVRQTILDDFLPAATTSKTAAPSANSAAAPRTPAAPANAAKRSRSPEYLASRDQVAGSIRNLKDWWLAETENYILLSNLGSRHRVMVKELQEDIEYIRHAYEQFLPPRVDVKAVSVIRLFAEAPAYEAYVGPSFSWSGGVWMPDKKELVIRPSDWGTGKGNREQVLRTTFHEAFHQYIFYAMDQAESAVWFNEGTAAFFENARIDNRKLTVEEDPSRVRTLETLLRQGAPDLRRLLSMSYGEFYAKDDEARDRHYALAWAFVYYLRKAAPLEKPAVFDGLLEAYTEALWKTRDGLKATDTVFADKDLDRLARDFTDFWNSRNRRGAAARNRIFRDYNPGASPRH